MSISFLNPGAKKDAPKIKFDNSVPITDENLKEFSQVALGSVELFWKKFAKLGKLKGLQPESFSEMRLILVDKESSYIDTPNGKVKCIFHGPTYFRGNIYFPFGEFRKAVKLDSLVISLVFFHESVHFAQEVYFGQRLLEETKNRESINFGIAEFMADLAVGVYFAYMESLQKTEYDDEKASEAFHYLIGFEYKNGVIQVEKDPESLIGTEHGGPEARLRLFRLGLRLAREQGWESTLFSIFMTIENRLEKL